MNLSGSYKEIVLFKRPGELDNLGTGIVQSVEKFANFMGMEFHIARGGRGDMISGNALFVAVGGDGTMLGAMRAAVEFNTGTRTNSASVIGFNAGHLGFLTEDILPTDVDTMLHAIYRNIDSMKYEDRMVIETTIDGIRYFAVNEFVFTGVNVSSPLVYNVAINDNRVAEHMGSGVLVSTATGSTAQALSAGGSIVHPSTNVMEIVPLMPHTLTSRPIITTGRDTVTICSEMDKVNEVIISADGVHLHSFVKPPHEDITAEIVIKKAEYPARVWHRSNRNFFDVLSTKLKW